jgi:hypothetical protein
VEEQKMNRQGFTAKRILLVASLLSLSGTSLPSMAQNIFSSGSTGADGPLVFYAPPPVRYGAASAYDSDRGVVVMFGGAQGDAFTYEWDGVRWNKKTTANSPTARYGHMMAYDSARKVTVLFGGLNTNSSGILNDLWEYDGTNWVQRTIANPPPARLEGAMAFDANRNKIVLTGGYYSTYENDTWEYDGASWSQKSPALPLPQLYGHSMAYDSDRHVTVLFDGGAAALGYRNNTYEWDGTNWTLKTPAVSPPPGGHRVMAYDSLKKETVLFGGDQSDTQTWIWTGGNWQTRTPASAPSPHNRSTMAFDAQRGQAVLFSGSNDQNGAVLNDTWLWNGVNWTTSQLTQPDVTIDMTSHPDGVWNYTTITIPAGVKVHFQKNLRNSPVVWLASGDVTIQGEIILDGAAANTNPQPGNEAQGGPGGYAGGLGGIRFDVSGSYAGTPGQGPGGGKPGVSLGEYGGDGGYGSPGSGDLGGPIYGNRMIRRLIGGSGGGGGASVGTGDGGNGGGGGGAILIASSGNLRMDGYIHSLGGSPSNNSSTGGIGSGGAIRLVANRVEGNGQLRATGSGGEGRIRTEGFYVSLRDSIPINASSPPVPIDLASLTGRKIVITGVAGLPVADPPTGNTSSPDVIFSQAGEITISISTTGIPTGTILKVRIAVSGSVQIVESTPTSADGKTTAKVTVPGGIGTIQAYASFSSPP